MVKPSGRAVSPLISGLGWALSGKGAGALLHVLVIAALARLLSPAEFGVVAGSLVAIMFLSILTRLGLGHALVQRDSIHDGSVATSYLLSLGIGLLLAGCAVALADGVQSALRIEGTAPVIRSLALLFPLRALLHIAESLLQRDSRFRELAAIDVGAYAIGFGIVGVGAAVAGLGLWSLVLAHYAEAILALVLAIHRTRRLSAGRADVRLLPGLLGYGGGVTAGKVLNQLALQADNFVVARFLGAAALGMYSRAYQLMATPGNLLGEGLDRVLFPAMSRLTPHARDLERLFLRAVGAVSLATLPVSVLVVVLAPELVALLLGPQWPGVVAPLRVLALGIFFRTSYRISDSLAYAGGAVYRRAWRQALYAVCVVTGATIGARYGVTGVAAGVLAALGMNYAVMAQLSLRQLAIPWRTFMSAQGTGAMVAGIVAIAALPTAAALRFLEVPGLLVIAGASGSSAALLYGAVRTGRFACILHEALGFLPEHWSSRLMGRQVDDAAKRAWDGPENDLVLDGCGITEQLIMLNARITSTGAPPDRRTRAALARYLPLKIPGSTFAPEPDDLWAFPAVAYVRWADPSIVPDPASVEAAYREASAGAGRDPRATAQRLRDIRRYADAVRRGARFPPVLLYHDGERLLQLDGARRILAHVISGTRSLPATVVTRMPAPRHECPSLSAR